MPVTNEDSEDEGCDLLESGPFNKMVKREEDRIRKASEEGKLEEVMNILLTPAVIWAQLFLLSLSISINNNNDQLASFLLLHAEEQKKEVGVLLLAAARGNIEVMEIIIKRGWNRNYSNKYHPIHMTAQEGQIEMIEYLIKKGENVNQNGPSHLQPLHLACQGGHIAMVQLLLKRGADINGNLETTPLMTAIKNQHVEVVKLLIREGARVKDKEEGRNRAFYLAALEGNFEIASLLVSSGSDVSGTVGYSPFAAACSSSLEVLTLLMLLFI